MWKQLKDKTRAAKDMGMRCAKALWCHRLAYAGLAAAYGAGCAGWLDKEVVNQIVTGCYVALVAQR